MKRMKIGKFDVHCITKTFVYVGCTKVTKAQILRLLKLMANPPKMKFSVGSKVKVVRDIQDSACVLGLTGKILAYDDDASDYGPLIQFPGFTNGHGVGNASWYVPVEALAKAR